MRHLELLPSFVSALESQPSTRCEVVQTQYEVCQSHCLERHAISPYLLADIIFKHRCTQGCKLNLSADLLPRVVFELPRLHSIAIAIDLGNYK
jgi:hypothetical protein